MTRVARDDLRKMIQTRAASRHPRGKNPLFWKKLSEIRVQLARLANFSRALSHTAGLRWC
jgi:hypothetical protein